MVVPLHTRALAVVHYRHFVKSLRRVSTHYGVSKSSLWRWVSSSDIALHQQPSRRRPNVNNTCRRVTDVLRAFVEVQPSCTLSDMLEHVRRTTGLSLSKSSIHRAREAANITRKRLTRMLSPSLSDPERVRGVHEALVGDAPTVSIDETGVYVRETSRYGYSLRGRRARLLLGSKPTSTRRCTVIAAIAADGVVSYDVIDGACNQQAFSNFINRLQLPPGTKLLMDNASIHRTSSVARTCEQKGFHPVYTPPYSPWCNPIELAFSKVKAIYRRATSADCSVEGFIDRLLGSFELLEASDCRAYFRHVTGLTYRFLAGKHDALD